MINRLVVFGATGDLTARYLLPALAALQAAGHIDDDFRLTGASREDWDTDRFREWCADQLNRHGGSYPAAARTAVAASAHYRRADVTDPVDVAAVIVGDDPIAVYLALPPALFPHMVTALHEAGLPPGSRIVLEKPFGEDLASARRLNRLLAGLVPEQAVFRVDHFLAMTTVQNVLGSRLANRMLEPIWNSTHISDIEIVWDETLALEGRAGYYDGVGALKDMVQNHLLQLLCLVAMEPPITLGERDLRDRKVDVLRSVRLLTDYDVVHRTRRARYLSGRVGDHAIPAYVDEAGVDPGRHTETFAEVELELDSWRWSGTTFRLRSGKALRRNRKEVAVRFRPVPPPPGEVSSGGEGVGVVGAQHPDPVGQHFGVHGGGPGRISRLPPPPGQVVPGVEGIGVVRAQHPYLVGQQPGQGGGGPGRVPRLPPPPGEVVSGGEGVGVVGAEVGRGVVGDVLVVVPGSSDLAGIAEATAGAIQHRMCVGPVQRLFGAGGEGGGVGAQGLREDGVTFDLGPGRDQGVCGGAGELSVPVGGEGVAGGALDELVDADSPVGGVGCVVDEAEPVQGA